MAAASGAQRTLAALWGLPPPGAAKRSAENEPPGETTAAKRRNAAGAAHADEAAAAAAAGATHAEAAHRASAGTAAPPEAQHDTAPPQQPEPDNTHTTHPAAAAADGLNAYERCASHAHLRTAHTSAPNVYVCVCVRVCVTAQQRARGAHPTQQKRDGGNGNRARKRCIGAAAAGQAARRGARATVRAARGWRSAAAPYACWRRR